MPKHSFNNIYITRFIAAFSVVAFHFLDGAIQFGGNVNYFFFLSGFVMVIAYRNIVEGKYARRRQALRFYIKRFARIYPLYLLGFLFFVCMSYRETGILVWNRVEFFLELFGLQRLFFHWSMNTPAWTISAEVVFYVLFPFSFPFLWHLPSRRMCVYVISFYLLSLMLNILLGQYLLVFLQSGHVMEKLLLTVFNHPFLKWSIFLLGNCCGILFVRYSDRRTYLLPYLALPSLFLIGYLTWLTPKDSVWVQSGLLCPLYFLLVWTLCIQGKTISTFLGNQFFIFLGRISYGIYILQVPVFLFFKQMTGDDRPFLPPSEFALYMIMLISVASLLYLFYEKPMKIFILNKIKAKYNL